VSARKSSKTNVSKAVSSRKIAAATPATSSPAGEYERAGKAADFIFSQTAHRPKIALVLGSGLGAFADEFADAAKIPYAKIPHFPQSTAIGHAGNWSSEKWEQSPWPGCRAVSIFMKAIRERGGLSHPRFARMGVKAVILTNAAGGIKRNSCRAGWCDQRSHQLQGVNPLTGRTTRDSACVSTT